MELLLIHEILFCLWQIYLFIYVSSLHFFTNNGMIRKISKTEMWPGRPIVFYYSYCLEKLYGNQLQGVKLIHLNDPLFITGI